MCCAHAWHEALACWPHATPAWVHAGLPCVVVNQVRTLAARLSTAMPNGGVLDLIPPAVALGGEHAQPSRSLILQAWSDTWPACRIGTCKVEAWSYMGGMGGQEAASRNAPAARQLSGAGARQAGGGAHVIVNRSPTGLRSPIVLPGSQLHSAGPSSAAAVGYGGAAERGSLLLTRLGRALADLSGRHGRR